MSTSPHLQLLTLPRPHELTPSLADVLSSTSVLSLTSSTESPPDSSNLDMSLASRIPPELLLGIFSTVGDSPSRDHDQYLERNRNLKSFALVHRTWRPAARETLREEVYIRGTDEEMASDEEIERISGLLIGSKVQGTKYVTVHGHLNELMAKTGSAMWSQVSYLKLLTSSRNDGTTQMSDFARFPRLQELYLAELRGDRNLVDLGPSDIHLRFPELRRISIASDVDFGYMGQVVLSLLRQQAQAFRLFDITSTLFSPSNMPKLKHLAVDDEDGEALGSLAVLMWALSHQVATLAIKNGVEDTAEALADRQFFANLKHLSLNGLDNMVEALLDHNNVSLESLHLSSWMVANDEELLARLLAIAKCEDSHNRIGRIVIYGSRRNIETKYGNFVDVDELNVLEWREDRDHPFFEGFDGR